jgi:hypothetical protein
MIGIVVDTTIISLLINKYIPKLKDILENKEGFLGDFIGKNFINRGLTNIFSNNMIDKDISLLIWDYLFLEGNIVLFKAFLAIYKFLCDKIVKAEKSLESYNEILNHELKTLKFGNEEFVYNLFFYHNNSISNMDFDDYRFCLSLQVADLLEEQNIEHVKSKVKLSYDKKLYEKELNKVIQCNKKWPYCISDTYFENVTKIVFYTVFHEINNKYIENYFFSEDNNEKEKEKEKENKSKSDDDKRYFNIRIERRQHYCNDIQNELTKEEINNEIEENDGKFIENENIILNDKGRDNENKNGENNEKDLENENIILSDEEKDRSFDSNKSEYINRILTQDNYLNITKVIEQKMDEQIFAAGSVITLKDN